jgi:hypothetical protein
MGIIYFQITYTDNRCSLEPEHTSTTPLVEPEVGQPVQDVGFTVENTDAHAVDVIGEELECPAQEPVFRFAKCFIFQY